MKFIINISRFIVGVLFIFSGLIKANDPLGLSYKMQEFFEIWNIQWLNHFALALSIIMIAFEIVAGIAVLLGWKMRIFSWLLLLLILFFSLLTGYAYLSGKVRECGCFGDCIPITAGQSFSKDLILLFLILFLFAERNKFRPLLNPTASAAVLIVGLIASFSFQWYVLQHLPLVDCLPYKIGTRIQDKMKPPPGSVPDSTVISFVYKKNGKEIEFTADKFPADFGDQYVFVKRYDKLIRQGNAVPAIKDFVLNTVSGTDTTQAVLAAKGYKLFLFTQDMPEVNPVWNKALNILVGFAKLRNVPMYLITSNEAASQAYLIHNGLDSVFTLLSCDAVAVKTAARANPTLYLLKQGTVLEKWASADFEQAIAAVNGLPDQPQPANYSVPQPPKNN